LGATLATLISADALATLAQVTWWDAPRVQGPLDAVLLLISVCGPLLAALVLWGAVGHRQRLPEEATEPGAHPL
jgi:hypothetical protein